MEAEEEVADLGLVENGDNKKKYQRTYSQKQSTMMSRLDSFYTEFIGGMKDLPAEFQGAPPIGVYIGLSPFGNVKTYVSPGILQDPKQKRLVEGLVETMRLSQDAAIRSSKELAAAGCQVPLQPAAQANRKQQPIYQRMQATFNMHYKTNLKPAAERQLDAKMKGQV